MHRRIGYADRYLVRSISHVYQLVYCVYQHVYIISYLRKIQYSYAIRRGCYSLIYILICAVRIVLLNDVGVGI